jgi:anti-sigma factor RsiW
MKACPEHEETLWLDVYGELDPDERPAWEKHLEACENCRRERKQLALMLQTMRVNTPSPTFSREETLALASSIARKLREEREETWWRKRLFGIPNNLIPALTAACILIVALGWFSMKGLRGPSSMTHLNSEERMLAKDLDIIKNLDMLEEMDTLQRLVQVVDNGDIPSTTEQN